MDFYAERSPAFIAALQYTRRSIAVEEDSAKFQLATEQLNDVDKISPEQRKITQLSGTVHLSVLEVSDHSFQKINMTLKRKTR